LVGFLKRRIFLIGSMAAVLVGMILLCVIGPMVAFAGIVSHATLYGIYMPEIGQRAIITEYTSVYWTGLGLSVVGLIIVLAGDVGLILREDVKPPW
jgi:hypothetical protein